MQIHATQNEAILLYRDRPAIDLAAFGGPLNAALADLGLAFETTDLVGDEFAVLTHPKMHLHLTHSRVPMPRKVAARALEAPISEMRPHDYVGLFGAHRQTLTLSLGDGPAPGAARPSRPVALDIAVMVLFRALRVALEADRPLAVLWEQSDMIFAPEEVEAADPLRFPAGLAIRPEPIPAAGGPGLRAMHSEMFCGRQLFVRPGALPFATAARLAEKLVEAHVSRATAVAEGVVLPFEEDRQLRIHRDPDPRFGPTGGFEMRIEPRGTTADVQPPQSSTAPPGEDVDRDRFPAAARLREVSRSRARRTWAICLALGTIMPVAAAALFVWNLVRGPNLAVSAVACAAVLAVFVGLSGVALGTGSEMAQAALSAMRSPF